MCARSSRLSFAHGPAFDFFSPFVSPPTQNPRAFYLTSLVLFWRRVNLSPYPLVLSHPVPPGPPLRFFQVTFPRPDDGIVPPDISLSLGFFQLTYPGSSSPPIRLFGLPSRWRRPPVGLGFSAAGASFGSDHASLASVSSSCRV